MKKIYLLMCICFICVLAFFANACSNTETDDGNVDSVDDYYQYTINDTIFSYDADEDKVYYVTAEYNTSVGANGLESKALSRYILNVMNLDGVLENSYTVPIGFRILCVSGGRIFYIADNLFDEVNDFFFYEFDKDANKAVLLGSSSNYNEINKIEEAAGKLYFLGINKDYTNMEYSLASLEDRFSYSGERIGCLDLESGNIEELPIDLPVAFAKAPHDNLLIYAYDQEKGYYFTIYNTASSSFSERIYHNMEQLTVFDVINENYDFIYLTLKGDSFTLTVSSPYPDGGQKDLIPNFPLSAMFNISCFGDFTYCTDLEGKNIIRVQNSAYLKSNKQIIMYCKFSNTTPFGCGYNIKNEVLTNEELSLALLSQDPAFDICCINSYDDISANIRDKGSFYPLNNVSGVKEYLDLCFPYVKEAATNSDGDIWMLPIYVDIPCFIYNESICQTKGIEFFRSMTIEELLNTIDKVKQEEALKEYYEVNNLSFTKCLFYQYLRSNNSFNTDLFKRLAPSFKNTINYTDNISYGSGNVFYKFAFKDTDFMFVYIPFVSFILDKLEYPVVRAAGIPYITENESNVGTCYFITVNPASKNLKETLKYISSLCKYLSSYNPYVILKDRALYPDTQVMDDIYEIYSNGDIQFTYPNELFIDTFEKFLAGEIELDSFIKEADRRLDTYLKE